MPIMDAEKRRGYFRDYMRKRRAASPSPNPEPQPASAAKAAKAAPASQREWEVTGKWMAARLEVDRLTRELAEARKSEPEQVAALRRHILALEQERARRDSAAKAARTRAARPADPDAEDPRIKALKTANHNLRKKVNDLLRHMADESQRRGLMTFTASSQIAKALHPDSRPSDAEREAAFKAFSAWKADKDGATRRRAR